MLSRHQAHKRVWREFLAVLNGWIWLAGAQLTHYIMELENQGQLNEKVCKAIIALLFRSLPATPNEGKWTKRLMSLDWWLVAWGVLEFLDRLWPIAYGKISLEHRARVAKEASQVATGASVDDLETNYSSCIGMHLKAVGVHMLGQGSHIQCTCLLSS